MDRGLNPNLPLIQNETLVGHWVIYKKLAIVNLAKSQAIALQVKCLVITLAIAQKHMGKSMVSNVTFLAT